MNAQYKLFNMQTKWIKNEIIKDKKNIKLLKAEIVEVNEILSKLPRTDILYKEKTQEKRKLVRKLNLLEKIKTNNEKKMEVRVKNKWVKQPWKTPQNI